MNGSGHTVFRAPTPAENWQFPPANLLIEIDNNNYPTLLKDNSTDRTTKNNGVTWESIRSHFSKACDF